MGMLNPLLSPLKECLASSGMVAQVNPGYPEPKVSSGSSGSVGQRFVLQSLFRDLLVEIDRAGIEILYVRIFIKDMFVLARVAKHFLQKLYIQLTLVYRQD